MEAIETRPLRFCVALEVQIMNVTTIDLRTENMHVFPPIHAVWGGRCLDVSAEALSRWAYGLVGVAVTGDAPARPRMLLDLDALETSDADRTLGLQAIASTPDGERRVELSLGELWDALANLAGQ